MKSQFAKKFLIASFLGSALLFTHIACSGLVYQQVSSVNEETEQPSRGIASINDSDKQSQQILNPDTTLVYEYTKPLVEGYATGIPKSGVENEWESYAPAGSSIQIHYSISDIDSYQTSFQIFPVGGAEEKRNGKADNTLLAQGTDGKPYAFAQYANLEKVKGLHIFNLPLKFTFGNNSEQFLKTGDYKLYITACATRNSSSCRKSRAIIFSVK